MTQMHVEPLPTPIVKGKYDGKSENYSVKLKLRRYPTSITLDFYEFNMSLFDNGNLEEFFFRAYFQHEYHSTSDAGGGRKGSIPL